MKTASLMRPSRLLYLSTGREAGGLQADVLRHPRLIPALVAAVIVVALAWIGIALSRWRRITWREHMDAPISLAPKEARWNGAGAAWKVFTYRGEVADPSLVLVRVKNSGFRSISAADIKRPITFTFPGRAVKEFSMTGSRGITREIDRAVRAIRAIRRHRSHRSHRRREPHHAAPSHCGHRRVRAPRATPGYGQTFWRIEPKTLPISAGADGGAEGAVS